MVLADNRGRSEWSEAVLSLLAGLWRENQSVVLAKRVSKRSVIVEVEWVDARVGAGSICTVACGFRRS